MKKLVILAIAVAAVVAFTAPAFAKYTIGGVALTDFGWRYRSEERTTSGNDVTGFFLDVPGHSRFNASWVNAAKDTGMFIEFGLRSVTGTNEGVTLRHIYGWYKIGNCKLLIGHTDTWAGTLAFAPSQNLALHQGLHLLLMGWGVFWSERNNQIQFSYMKGGFGFQIVLADPQAPGFPTGDQFSLFPRVELALQLRVGGFGFIPGFTWLRVETELPNGVTGDDDVDAWIINLPAKFNVGGLSIRGGFHYGQNIYLLSPTFYGPGAGVNAFGPLVQANGSVEDTDVYGGYLAIHYRIGAIRLVGGAGFENADNDLYADDLTRWGIFGGVQYSINKHFMINPELGYYNHDENPLVQGSPDAGEEWILGIQFKFWF
jgi:hypothetical protein